MIIMSPCEYTDMSLFAKPTLGTPPKAGHFMDSRWNNMKEHCGV